MTEERRDLNFRRTSVDKFNYCMRIDMGVPQMKRDSLSYWCGPQNYVSTRSMMVYVEVRTKNPFEAVRQRRVPDIVQ